MALLYHWKRWRIVANSDNSHHKQNKWFSKYYLIMYPAWSSVLFNMSPLTTFLYNVTINHISIFRSFLLFTFKSAINRFRETLLKIFPWNGSEKLYSFAIKRFILGICERFWPQFSRWKLLKNLLNKSFWTWCL